jgi:hypothetical protein
MYYKFFPKENILIVRYEDIEERGSVTVVNEIAEWLGIGSLTEEDWGLLSPVNVNSYDAINPDEEAFLKEFYRVPNQQLYQLIGRDMGWDD